MTGCCRGLRGPRRNPQPHTGTRLQVSGAGHSDDLDRRQPSLRKGQVLYADMPNYSNIVIKITPPSSGWTAAWSAATEPSMAVDPSRMAAELGSRAPRVVGHLRHNTDLGGLLGGNRSTKTAGRSPYQTVAAIAFASYISDMSSTREHQKTRKAKEKEPSRVDENTIDADLANQALCDLNQILDEPASSSGDVDLTIEGHTKIVRLPRGLGEILRQILASAAAGRAVAVMPAHAELTTQQAADMLNVSRPYLIKLVEEGVIKFRKVGTHRRIQASSVREYQRQMELDSKKAADELTELTEELELY